MLVFKVQTVSSPTQAYASMAFMNRMRIVNFALLSSKRAETKLAGI
jgi:hypothetical protein